MLAAISRIVTVAAWPGSERCVIEDRAHVDKAAQLVRVGFAAADATATTHADGGRLRSRLPPAYDKGSHDEVNLNSPDSLLR